MTSKSRPRDKEEQAGRCQSSQHLTSQLKFNDKRFEKHPHLGWVTHPTGLWTMISLPQLRPDSPGARQRCSPRRGTLSRARLCALWAFWFYCCFSWWYAASASYSILTAVCLHPHGLTTRGWTEGSSIMQWCKEKGGTVKQGKDGSKVLLTNILFEFSKKMQDMSKLMIGWHKGKFPGSLFVRVSALQKY